MKFYVEGKSEEKITLVDFASAGKRDDSQYTTWLRIDRAPMPAAFEREVRTVWVNRNVKED